MYRIVIAEDEADVRKSIVKCIDDAENEYQIIGEAGDGQEAIELVERLQPDILLTDICMPKLNGLDLIRSIKEASRNVETVIISGYDEFRYIKEAMGMGVRDYLLKPFSPQELFGILDKICKELKHKEVLAQNIENMHQQIEKEKKYTRERLLRKLLQEENSVTEKELAEAGVKLEGNWYGCCIIRFFMENNHRESGNLENTLQKFLQIVEENYFVPEIRTCSLDDGKNQLVLFFSCKEESLKAAKEDVANGIQKIAASMDYYYGIRMQCTRGSLVAECGKLSQSYREAGLLWKKVLDQEQILVEYDSREQLWKRNDMDQQTSVSRLEETQKNLILAVQMGNMENALAELDAIFTHYSQLPMERSQYLSMSFVRLAALVCEQQGSGEEGEIIRYLENDLKNGSLLEAKQVLEEYIKKCCTVREDANKPQGDKIIDTAIAFIEGNLGNEDLNLDMVAEALHFSPSYIRQLFKNVKEENFSDYLFRRRMELAAELLLNPLCKIQEIAERTGYSNQRYFARCFRKYYGCTPTDYRNEKCIK